MQPLNEYQTTQLERLTALLVSCFSIEAIYIRPSLNKTPTYSLIIILCDKYHRILGEIVPKIKSKIREFNNFEPICFSLKHTRKRIAEGNLYLTDNCKAEYRVYPKSAIALEEEIPTQQECISSTRLLWERQFLKITEFAEGYHYLKSRRKYTCAAFMLHQSMELTYKAMEILLISKERISHSIRNHHNYLMELTPLYNELFDQNDEEDISLLETLIELYRASRYEESYEVRLSTLDKLELRMVKLHANANYIFKQIVDCRSENILREVDLILSSSDPTTEVIQTELPQLIVQQISEKIQGVLQIFRFGYRKSKNEIIYNVLHPGSSELIQHLDLLVVTESDQKKHVFSLMASLNQDPKLSIQLLNFSKNQIQHGLSKNHKFFHRILMDQLNLLFGSSIAWQFHGNVGERSPEEMAAKKLILKNRIKNAQAFFSAGKFLKGASRFTVKLALFNQCLEQCCLGLLSSTLDIVPYSSKLNQLFLLSDSFWEFPREIFPRTSQEELQSFQQLVEAPSVLKFRSVHTNPDIWIHFLEEKCERFLEECETICKTEDFV
ncbi:HEPN domain-containing protein [Sphingobacterium sp. UBA6645]|uniref:HEPN domain-containing protein n=1 Tax=Sphingobacterium sp. UBA6645 TaxID=1947511 RepID=UPI0025CD8260|nr:HEPN domain-containing protein [Sphingobacterium sp. UBA6645]